MAGKVDVHPLALNESANVGEGTRIWAYAHVMAGAQIGKNCNIGEHCFIERGAILGNGVTLKNGVCVWEGVVIEDFCFIGPLVALTNDRYPRSPRLELDAVKQRYAEKNWLENTLIGHGASIGANATIICGTTLGRFSTVAAGALVTHNVADFQMVAGVPAKVFGVVCMCGRRMVQEGLAARCAGCGRGYEKRKGVWSPV